MPSPHTPERQQVAYEVDTQLRQLDTRQSLLSSLSLLPLLLLLLLLPSMQQLLLLLLPQLPQLLFQSSAWP